MTDALEHASEVSVTAGRKKQLERYEPIDERVTLTVDLTDADSVEEKRKLIEDIEQEAWDQCERGLMGRYEDHVREEAFGDDEDE